MEDADLDLGPSIRLMDVSDVQWPAVLCSGYRSGSNCPPAFTNCLYREAEACPGLPSVLKARQSVEQEDGPSADGQLLRLKKAKEKSGARRTAGKHLPAVGALV